jgi:hypothetical protein
LALSTGGSKPGTADAFQQNILKRKEEVAVAPELKQVEPTKLRVGDATVTLPGTPVVPGQWWSDQQRQAQQALSQYKIPIQEQYGPNGIRLSFVSGGSVGPNYEPLPPGAAAFDKYGRPYFGDPNKGGIVGDLEAEAKYLWYRLTKPTEAIPKAESFNATFMQRLRETWTDLVASTKPGRERTREEDPILMVGSELLKATTEALN